MNKLSDLVEFNPTVRLKKGVVAPFIEMAALPTNARDIPEIGAREFSGSGSKFENGDTLFARITPCLENGKGGYISTLGAGISGHGSTEFIVMRARSQADSLFVYYVTRDPEFRRFAEKQMSGTSGRQRVAWQSIAEYELPTIEQSQRAAIAATLGALDDKIELNRRMNATLEAMARALFRDWFVDFGPTRARMAGTAPHLSPDLWSLFPDRLDDEGKPEGWEVSTIGDEVRVVGGSTPSTKEPDFWDGGINWATPKDLSNLAAPVLLETSRTISEAGLAKISSGLLPVGAVLLSSRAPIGYLAIAEVPVAINQGFIGMICDKRLSNVFAWLWTLENMEAILAKANGSTFQEISKGNFRPLPVVVAPDPVLHAFDAIAKPLYERIARNERESRTLAQTRDLLLPRLMSGELRVAQAERIVEEAL
ncbi:MAG: restriction endonuclease subunit S [Erythrobacter sp.]|nr:restriction endonuclease subunit S [Erythrobacter sp.]